MKNSEKKLTDALLIILFSPLILLGLFFGAIVIFFDWLKEPSRKKAYTQSHYYKAFQTPYRKGIIYEESYLFYNKAADDNISVNMVHPANGGADYLIIQGSVFLFPMNQNVFGGISYNIKEQQWVVDFDGEYFPLDDEWGKYKKTVEASEPGLPCYLLIKQSEVCSYCDEDEEFGDGPALDLLPPYVRVVWEYIDIVKE